MDKDHFAAIPENPNDAASYWFTRVRGGLMGEAEAAQFARWRALPEHDQAYREMLAVWRVAETVPDEVLRAIVSMPPKQETVRSAVKRRHLRWSFAVLSAAAVTGVASRYALMSGATFTRQYATDIGERRQVTLPDGSIVNLNTATTMTVHYSDDRRYVDLTSGEAVFSVASNKEKPFIVEAGLGRVRVTGTLFSVRRDTDRVSVGVESGSVEVTRGTWWWRHTEVLATGQGVTVSADAMDRMPEGTDVSAIAAWQQGKVVFDGTALPRVVAEINRYRKQPIRLQGELMHLRIAGVFSVDDTETFLTILPALIPVSVLRKKDGTAMIIARSTSRAIQ